MRLHRKLLVLAIVFAVGIGAFYFVYFGSEGDSTGEVTDRTSVKISVTETAPPSMNSDSIKETGDVWVGLIDNAETSICIGAYYLGSAGPQWRLSDIYDSLEGAAGRGVEVRILVDSSNSTSEMVSELGGNKNIKIEAWSGDGVLHSKYIIVDGSSVSLGSTNLSYYAMENHGGNREINVLIQDNELVQSYQYIFETGWEQAGGEPREFYYNWAENWITPVADGTGDKSLLTTIQTYEKLFDYAENHVYIYTYLYAGMPSEMSSSMDDALERGVEIKFLLDSHSVSEHPSAVEGLDDMENVNVYIIDHPHAAHAKFAVVDGEWCYIGSSNIHPEWMYEGRQIGVLVNSKDVAGSLINIFEKDWLSVNTHEYS